MRHRALEYPAQTPVRELGLAALDDLLERGDLADWTLLLREVRRDPWGALAERILHLVDSHQMGGTSTLWRSWIESRRGGPEPAAAGPALRRLREERGLTQGEMARRLGITQPEVSKLERRPDVRLSTMRAYVAALGGRLRLSASIPEGERELG